MKKTICLVRHGETDQNKAKKIQGRTDFLLNDFGRHQASQAGIFLNKQNINFDMIVSSPLSRACETAYIIRKEINSNLEIIKNPAFIERDFGVAEGLDVNQENFVKVLDDSYERMEKSYEIQNRVYNGLLDLVQNTNATNILIVCHSHTIKALLSKLDSTRTFMDPLCNCSINYIIYEDNKLKIKETNINPLENANQ